LPVTYILSLSLWHTVYNKSLDFKLACDVDKEFVLKRYNYS